MSPPESGRDNSGTPHQAQALADQLADLGFYRYANPRRIIHLKAQFAHNPTLWKPSVRRDYPADEERLAEGTVRLTRQPAQLPGGVVSSAHEHTASSLL